MAFPLETIPAEEHPSTAAIATKYFRNYFIENSMKSSSFPANIQQIL